MTQPPKFDPETVARIIDGAMRRALAMAPSDQEAWRFTADKSAAAIMGLHAADPARQMADAEAALWREHDARHDAAEISRLRADLADVVRVLEDALRTVKQYAPNGIERSVRFVTATALLSRLKDAKP